MRYKIMQVYYNLVIGLGMLIEAILDAMVGE